MNSKELESLPVEGYWNRPRGSEPSPYDRTLKNYPYAEDCVDETWDPAERERVVNYLELAGFEAAAYRGMSRCRFCNKFNGSTEITDGTYRWPEGLSHYLREHGVKPSQDFIDHVLSKPPVVIDPLRTKIQDILLKTKRGT